MKVNKPAVFNYAKAMNRIEELERANKEQQEEIKRLRTNLEIKERIERTEGNSK